jgi:uncharacterized protein YecE (DUF72 family)
VSTQIRVGTSSFTADGWTGAFYPKGMKSADYLGYYSSRFDTVEVDSTFYRCPTMEAVRNWARKTPPGFIFSLKIPRTITHEKVLIRVRQGIRGGCWHGTGAWREIRSYGFSVSVLG